MELNYSIIGTAKKGTQRAKATGSSEVRTDESSCDSLSRENHQGSVYHSTIRRYVKRWWLGLLRWGRHGGRVRGRRMTSAVGAPISPNHQGAWPPAAFAEAV